MKTAILKKQIIKKIEHLDDLQILEDISRILDLETDPEENAKLNLHKKSPLKNQWTLSKEDE